MSSKDIFKAYDVRGAYPAKLNESIARAIGRATADLLGCQEALVGHDMRGSGVPLSEALIDGLREQGVDVTSIGLASSPLIYYAGRDYDSAICVTASHNPPPDNGMKICGRGALPIGSANGLMEIAEKALAGSFVKATTRGTRRQATPREEFISFSLESLHATRPVRVVVDGGNGIGGLDYLALAERDTPLEILPLYLDADDSFPNHEPNPLKFETLRDLQAEVLRQQADLGLALDGDADRCFFIDERGEIISADLITALIASDVLAEKPGATILYDLRSSRIVPETIRSLGGRAVECRVGHAFIKKALRDEGGTFAGELSGHFYFEESSFAENTLLALFRVLNILDKRGETLSQATAPLRKYHSSGEINSQVEDGQAIMQALAKAYADGEASWLDGLKIKYEDWWFNVRPSNTEPYLRLVLEATSAEEMNRRKNEILAVIRG